ncbi:MAG: ParB family chromosome partitioning protein [Saprospiraceae bacterium]|jgi:ParB family chromosome partitioning protein
MSAKSKKPALGKGLGALLGGGETNPIQSVEVKTILSDSSVSNKGGVDLVPLKQIEANPFQPRTHFDKDSLEELTASIREHGIIQPITVRELGKNRYQIISGERRFRASHAAGLIEVPVYVRKADDQTMLEMAIIENVQRKDLNAIEIAISYQRLIDECDITQEKVGERVSKSRSAVANYLRLLNLPDEIQAGIRDEKVSMGHARALLSFETDAEKIKVYRAILDGGVSVRKVEEMASSAKANKKKTTVNTELPKSIIKTKDNIAFHLGSKINISQDKTGKGKMVITFDDENHLKRIIEILDK